MRLVYDLINFLFYSNLWIAMAAIALSAQSRWLLTYRLQWTPLYGVIFFGTLFLYALHRLVGMKKVDSFTGQTRFAIVEKFKTHIFLYAVVAAAGGLWCLLQLPQSLIWALLPVALVSLIYVLPVLPSGKRGRDISFVKIFMIAISWSWVTVFLPALEVKMTWSIAFYLMFLERLFFIFAIALPFDIRDMAIDRHNRVQTIPSRFGIKSSKIMAAIVLVFMLSMVWLNYCIDAYSWASCIALGISALTTFSLVYFADKHQHDYYFSGLIDGAMILQCVLVLIFNYIAN